MFIGQRRYRVGVSTRIAPLALVGLSAILGLSGPSIFACQNTPENKDDKGGSGGGGSEQTDRSKWTSAEWEKFYASETTRITESAKAAGKSEAEQEAANKAAQEQGRYKDLYETEQTKSQTAERRVAELQKEADEGKKNADILSKQMEDAIKDWPPAFKTLFPKHLTISQQMKWVEDTRPDAERVKKLSDGPSTEGGASGRGGSGGSGGASAPKDPVQMYLDGQQFVVPGETRK